MKYLFREKNPVRTCTDKYDDYHKYRDALRTDFNERCAYCNLDRNSITTPFEIDHFVPQKEFKDVWPELMCTYENLVYSCKKCNRAKWNKFEGDLSKRIIDNEIFYDPVKVDYNKIFYRNEYGEICSDDKKGQRSISELNLYHPIHSLAWIRERISQTIEKISAQMEQEGKESERYQKLKEAKYDLMEIERDYTIVFTSTYNEN